jgi:hypothetical protein
LPGLVRWAHEKQNSPLPVKSNKMGGAAAADKTALNRDTQHRMEVQGQSLPCHCPLQPQGHYMQSYAFEDQLGSRVICLKSSNCYLVPWILIFSYFIDEWSVSSACQDDTNDSFIWGKNLCISWKLHHWSRALPGHQIQVLTIIFWILCKSVNCG